MRVCPLCLGAITFGGRTSAEGSARIIRRTVDAGIDVIDPANVYAGGRSEEAAGLALTARGARQQVILATEVHAPVGVGPNDRGNSRRHIVEQCEQSLRRLQTDWVDPYQLHRPQPENPIDETLRALDDLARSGKVRNVGTSSFAAWQIVEALWVYRRSSGSTAS